VKNAARPPQLLRAAAVAAFCGMAAPVASGARTRDRELAEQLREESDWTAARLELRRAELRANDRPPGAPSGDLRSDAEPDGRRTRRARPGGWPVRLMVGFYRKVVAPALGARCKLDPSCSSYSLQAARERGWLGIPMTGDRLIREPSVIVARERVRMDEDGRLRFLDPVSDHIGGRRFDSTTGTEENADD